MTGEKPLPSLPVATVVTKSPVHRRSLIDATERPLRRSLTPDLGHEATEETQLRRRPDSEVALYQTQYWRQCDRGHAQLGNQ
jgi:hypothetical protein